MPIDYPNDSAHDTIELKRDQLYKPGTEPAKPAADEGEIAVEVTAEQLPGTDEADEAFGLTREHTKLVPHVRCGGRRGPPKGLASGWRPEA